MKRLSKQSVENIKVADKIGILKTDSSGYPRDFMVWIERNGRRAFLHGGKEGDILIFKRIEDAQKRIKRIRPDLKLREI